VVVWNLIFTTILLPLIGIVVLALRARRPLPVWFATLFLAAGVVSFSVLVAPWGWFGIPLRIALIVLFVLAVIVSLWRKPNTEMQAAPTSAVRIFLMLLIGAFFGNVAMGVLRAQRVPFGAIDLAFPLTHGSYLVAHGGSEPAANIHAADKVLQYAVDLVKLNAAGMRARGIYPDDASRYAIFGDAVVSPCDGSVVSIVDGLADASRISIDEKNRLGNQIVIRCGDANITLAQLQRGSIVVKAGQAIARGAKVARVGNSGTSTEPHLHVHAERDGFAVPVRFDGRWLVRNTVVRK
jgi:hypothetical protein